MFYVYFFLLWIMQIHGFNCQGVTFLAVDVLAVVTEPELWNGDMANSLYFTWDYSDQSSRPPTGDLQIESCLQLFTIFYLCQGHTPTYTRTAFGKQDGGASGFCFRSGIHIY